MRLDRQTGWHWALRSGPCYSAPGQARMTIRVSVWAMEIQEADDLGIRLVIG